MRPSDPDAAPNAPVALMALWLLAVPAHAHTLSFNPGTHYDVMPAMEEFTTLGSDMAGMKMTVTQGGVSQVYTWGVLEDDYGGFTRGGVITPGFVIYATGDTWCFSGCRQWWVQSLGLQPVTRVVFHGSTAGVVFDLTTAADDFGTPGSAKGFTFEVGNQQSLQTVVNATYHNQVSVGGNPVVGDLWETLELQFAGPGLLGYIQFGADTDQIPPSATILPLVPEPGSMALLAAGLGVLGLRRRVQAARSGR